MSDTQCDISMEIHSDRSVDISVSGRVYSQNAGVLEHKLHQAFERGAVNITVDMSGVSFLSSAGIRALLSGYKRAAKAGGALRVSCASENVRNVLGATALDELMI